MNQIAKLTSGFTLKQKISIVAAAVLTVAGVIGLMRWKRESDFRPLYTGMAAEDAAAVVQKLRESAVEYRLGENGATVLVPSTKLADSRLALAAAGLPKSGRIGFELFDRNNFGATEFVEHVNYRRALEGELEKSIAGLAEVEEARVHLTLPKESIFVDKQQPAKASVMLKLRPGVRVAPQNVLAITNLVASAVEGLAPESVSIVDMNGNLLNRPRRIGEVDGLQATAESLEVRQQLERDLISKVSATLEPILGPAGFRVGAAVDYDTTSGEQQDESIDPTHSVIVSSQKTEDVNERASAAGGIPGTTANLPGAPAAHAPGTNGTLRRTENVVYQSSRTIRHTRIPQGVIRRVSLAVLVDHTAAWQGEGDNRRRVLAPPSPETMKSIRELVSATAGLKSERGDQLTVECVPFEATRNPEADFAPSSRTRNASPTSPTRGPVPLPQRWIDQVQSNRLLIGAVVLSMIALLALVRTVRRLFLRKPLPQPAVSAQLGAGAAAEAAYRLPSLAVAPAGVLPAADGERMELAERVRSFAETEAAVAANVIRLWLQEKETANRV